LSQRIRGQQNVTSASAARQRRVAGWRRQRQKEVSDVAIPELSPIEQQIVLLVAQGRSRRAIADELGLSLKTVDWHVARGRRKLERAATLHERMQAEGSATLDNKGRKS
jgi:DNA-binding CsgD family transcriptional regulator